MKATYWILCSITALTLALGSSGCDGQGNTASAAGGCPHEIKAEVCPFCNPELISSEGFCGEHAVAEALCAQCRPYMKAAFRAKGDWCQEHKTPESQCMVCNPELKENLRPGEHGTALQPTTTVAGEANVCPHGIGSAKCPFCTPALIESEGFCNGHGVAEALCVKCWPYLKTAFVTAGDWCQEHDTPESQCALCNPELENADRTPMRG